MVADNNLIMKSYHIIILTLVALLVASCSNSDTCQQDMSNRGLKVSLHRFVYDERTEAYRPEVYTLPMTVNGLGIDSTLYDSTFTSTLTLPLNPQDTISSFAITSFQRENDSIVRYADTLSVFHTNEIVLISLECGCSVNNNITQVSSSVNAIDSCVVENTAVSYLNAKTNNIKIYLHSR